MDFVLGMRSYLRALTPFTLSIASFPIAVIAADSPPAQGDVGHGKTLYMQSCALCHASGLESRPAAGQGPALAGVLGRRAASLPNFSYTKALTGSGLIWTAGTLDLFLAGPGSMVPGTNMVITVANPSDRADLIAFLSTLRPLPSPGGDGNVAHTPHAPSAGDWQNDAPGVQHRVRIEDLPPPYATVSAGNSPRTLSKPEGAHLSVPAGFQVKLFTSQVTGPRLLRKAPNGDIFIAETGAGRIRVLRSADGADTPSENSVFAEDLKGPFGIAFYPLGDDPKWVYVGNLNSVVRFPYQNGDLTARGPAEIVVPHLADSTGGHTTRDVVFSLDGSRMIVSVGSGSNVAEGMSQKSPSEIRKWEASHLVGSAWGYEVDRADVLTTDPEGHQPLKVYAAGIRNAVGLAIQPDTGVLWVSVNERDALGDDLVPDYVTHVREGGFYGWPWYYMGDHEDPRHAGERPDLVGHVIVPDVPEQSHSASLEMTFYPPGQTGVSAFPKEYQGDIFVALHGSWNRTGRTGSKVVRILLKDGAATGAYEDFMTGFVIDDGHVWGRPVGVAVARDGALLVTDDANSTVLRVSRSVP